MPASRVWKWIAAVLLTTSLFGFAAMHHLNHILMFTALVPVVTFLLLLVDSLHAAFKSQTTKVQSASLR